MGFKALVIKFGKLVPGTLRHRRAILFRSSLPLSLKSSVSQVVIMPEHTKLQEFYSGSGGCVRIREIPVRAKP